MTDTSDEDELFNTFATLADTMVADFDVVDLLQTLVEACVRVLEIAAAGILLANDVGELEVVASTSEAARLVELMQLSAQTGPCIVSFQSGDVVSLPDISKAPAEWNNYRASALEQGFVSVYAIPLRLRETTIGALNLLGDSVGTLATRDVRIAQALADVATIGILHERALVESNVVRDQLSQALQSRVLIEQAKGVISHTRSISTDDAFAVLRSYARANRLLLSEVARRVVNRELRI
jgi:transcriptional regulator with GAF, ATPase, and Fis domain